MLMPIRFGMEGQAIYKKEVRTLGSIIVKNRTTLTDFSALIRVGLYLAGEVEQATENGFSFQVNGNEVGTIVTITEAKKIAP